MKYSITNSHLDDYNQISMNEKNLEYDDSYDKYLTLEEALFASSTGRKIQEHDDWFSIKCAYAASLKK